MPAPPAFHIVGIGASAGGLEACSQLLHAFPEKVDFPIVLVQHLSPGHESFLAGLLGGATALPVVQVSDGMEVEPGHVYVVPPNVQMEIIDGRLTLAPRPHDRTQYMPVDHFFRSLAEYGQSRAIGVILSGNASDGAEGLREIKAAGGITVAQDPRSAKYDGMPRSAIATGIVDLTLAPEEIAKELVRISRHPLPDDPIGQAREAENVAAADLDLKNLTRIFAMLRQATGVDFSHYKLPTIRRRLHRRMVLHRLETLEQYVRFMQENSTEVHGLYQDILIHVTRFFRDPESFEMLASRVFADRGNAAIRADAPVRIWVPGCATGEEAYSIAIMLLEHLGEDAPHRSVQIFATDVSEAAIERARSGVYQENISADLSSDRLRRFFTRIDGHYRINKQVRDMCIFARQDLTRDPPFSKLDLIVCRNVLIYLGPVLQRRLMSVFHYALKPGGYLMLGSAETIGAHSDLFDIVEKRHKIYTKKATVARAEMDFPSGHVPMGGVMPVKKEPADDPRGMAEVQNEANRVVLSHYSPPGVLVDQDLRIIQFRGHTGEFLEPAPGDASLDLLKMAREGLLYGLRTALAEVKKSGTPAHKHGLRVKHNGDTIEVNLQVIPLGARGDGRFFLVLFESAQARPSKGRGKGKDKSPAKRGKVNNKSGGEVARLERELAASREYLQSMIQDLEAANEELQSANEEILSANEELQSTNEELDTAKEELQSTNEELNTVNEELSGRNDELSRVNSDLLNLLGSVQIAIVMVTNDLRIRRFTPMAEKILNLIPTDIGRPIGDIKPNIDCPDLERLITEAVDSVSIREQDCQDRNGNPYLLRVRPYKNVENRIDGAVLVLIDVAEANRRYDTSSGSSA